MTGLAPENKNIRVVPSVPGYTVLTLVLITALLVSLVLMSTGAVSAATAN